MFHQSPYAVCSGGAATCTANGGPIQTWTVAWRKGSCMPSGEKVMCTTPLSAPLPLWVLLLPLLEPPVPVLVVVVLAPGAWATSTTLQSSGLTVARPNLRHAMWPQRGGKGEAGTVVHDGAAGQQAMRRRRQQHRVRSKSNNTYCQCMVDPTLLRPHRKQHTLTRTLPALG